MTAYANTFEGGSNGTTITTGNSGGSSGDAWDVVTIGSGATYAFDNAHAAHGSLSGKVATGASSVAVLASKTFPSATTTGALRLYVYFTANPSTNTTVAQFRSGGTRRLEVIVTSTGKVRLANSAGTTVFTSTNSITLNAWVRIEVYSVTLDASSGAATIAFFNTPDSATATESNSSTSQNFGGSADRVSYGLLTNTYANAGPYWLDDIAENDTGTQIGPASGTDGTASPSTVTGTGTVQTATTTGTAVASPTVLAGTGTAQAPSVSGTATAAPTTLAGTGTVPAPTALAGALVTPVTLAGTGTVQAPTVTGTAVAAPATLAGVGTVQAPAPSGTGTASPATNSATGTVQTVTATGGATASPVTLIGSITIPAPTVSGAAVISPATVLGVGTVQAPTLIVVVPTVKGYSSGTVTRRGGSTTTAARRGGSSSSLTSIGSSSGGVE